MLNFVVIATRVGRIADSRRYLRCGYFLLSGNIRFPEADSAENPVVKIHKFRVKIVDLEGNFLYFFALFEFVVCISNPFIYVASFFPAFQSPGHPTYAHFVSL